jgi:hypothetical protein
MGDKADPCGVKVIPLDDILIRRITFAPRGEATHTYE